MKRKNKILIIFLAILNLILTSYLLVFIIPNEVPFLVDTNEKFVSFISKWFLLAFCFLPVIFALLAMLLKNKKCSFLFLILFVLSIYENFLYFSYFSLEKSIVVGNLSAIPISISIFMPTSVIIVILAIKLKNAPFLSKPALNFKTAKTTEFIWKQTHFYARDLYFFMGIIMFFISIIFAIFRYPLIEFAIFVLLIIAFTLKIYFYSKSIYKKYAEMKAKKEKLDKEKAEKMSETEKANPAPNKNTENKQKTEEKSDKNENFKTTNK